MGQNGTGLSDQEAGLSLHSLRVRAIPRQIRRQTVPWIALTTHRRSPDTLRLPARRAGCNPATRSGKIGDVRDGRLIPGRGPRRRRDFCLSRGAATVLPGRKAGSMDSSKPQCPAQPDDSRNVTVRILNAVATVLQDRADRWLKADKSNDMEEPRFRDSRFRAAFSDIGADLKQYNFYKALAWLKKFEPDAAAEVHTQMELLSKDLMGHQSVADPALDGAELDPNARRMSEVSGLLRRVANDLERQNIGRTVPGTVVPTQAVPEPASPACREPPQCDSDFDRKFMEKAVKEARKSVDEDGRVHPKVGVVVARGGKELAGTHRGEVASGDHAEFTALEKKLADEAVAGATVYTTLEPCTTRNHPKLPCADRLIERKVKRVVIGMLDPNPQIRGIGYQKLRNANIAVDLFDDDLKAEIEDMNREFMRHHAAPSPAQRDGNAVGKDRRSPGENVSSTP